jgi:peptidoglycan/LPS O-acetylase OafA/YrhL
MPVEQPVTRTTRDACAAWEAMGHDYHGLHISGGAGRAGQASARREILTSEAAMSLAVPIARTETAPIPTRARFFALELLDNRFAALHGLRCLAIVSVVAYHITWIFMGEQHIKLDPDFFSQSLTVFFGMDLFFVLSGFLIGSILLRSLGQGGGHHLRRFYLRRVFRTFPAYYVVLTVLAVAFPLTVAQRHHLLWEYLYGTNFLSLERGQVIMFWGWSLGLEEQFYLAVPLLLIALQRLRSDRARIALLAVLLAAALAIRFAVFYGHVGTWTDLELYGALYFRTHTRFDPLVAGILLAIVHHRYGRDLARWLETPFHRAVLALPALGCLWILLFPGIFGRDNQQIAHVFLWGTVTSIMYLLAVPLVLYGDGSICRWLGAPAFRSAATLGYGIYLVHIPIIDHVMVPAARAAQEQRWSMLFVWPAALAATLALATGTSYLLHVFVEKPALRLRDRFAR